MPVRIIGTRRALSRGPDPLPETPARRLRADSRRAGAAHRGGGEGADGGAPGAGRRSPLAGPYAVTDATRTHYGYDYDDPPERPADPAVRRAYLRRIVALFRPYRLRLTGVLGLILFSSLLGSIPAFLIKQVFDVALPENDLRLLNALVAGMIAIAVVTGALGVVQTLLSNQVGQRVMHDLRTAVYKHLQRLSLAFFTRTRTGEVQSRLANDIGGVQEVVTSTATSIVSNVSVVLATVIAMFYLDWRLTLFALALLPLFVWMTRRVGMERRKVAKVRQESMADISSQVQESLSVSGILLGKTMGRTEELARRFEAESGRLADLEVRSRMTGRWMMASIQTSFAVMPALVYLFAGHFAGSISLGTVIAFTTLQARLFFPIGSLLGVGLEVQTSLALFDRVFEYLDQPVDIEEGTRSLAAPRGDVAFRGVWFRYENGPWTLDDVSFDVPRGSKTALVGETGSGKTTAGYLVARLYDATRGSVSIDGSDVRDLTFESLANAVGVVRQETYLFHASVRDNLRFARADATDEEIEDAARAAQIHELIAGCPTATTPSSASAATASRAASGSGSRSRGRSCATRRSSSSTRRPPRSTRRRSAPSRRRSSGSPRAGRRLRSRTGSRPFATPTRSSCSTADASPRSARTTSCCPPAAATPRSSSRDTEEILSG